MKKVPLLFLLCITVAFTACSTAANRRAVYAPYQAPTAWDHVFPSWEAQKRPNTRIPDPFDTLPQLPADWEP